MITEVDYHPLHFTHVIENGVDVFTFAAERVVSRTKREDVRPVLVIRVDRKIEYLFKLQHIGIRDGHRPNAPCSRDGRI
jgi:hypothetical protein